MNTRRLGCLTPLGLFAALLSLLLIGTAGLAQGGQMFSPGSLNAAPGEPLGGFHSHAETAGQCSACHTAPWDAAGMNTRCLDCHTAVAHSLTNPATLHGFLQSETAEVDCRNCHTEHHGPQGALTNLEMIDYPHERTGFSLTGHARHADGAAFACRDCHEDFAGTPPTAVCADCHHQLDPAYLASHTAVFGLECLSCHDGIDSYGDTFDHHALDFPLFGKHIRVDCAGCHQDMTTIAALRSTPTDCFTCHRSEDAHNCQLGTDCAACHTPDGWTPADMDHSQTAFPLAGKHTAAGCTDCHTDNVYKGTPMDCFSCHQEDDAHHGRFGTDCETCHTPEGWEPAKFDHSRANFQLTGAHATVECETCHVNNVYHGTPSDCFSCHRADDAHSGSLGPECAACHSTTAWKPSTFDHNRSIFQLIGAHVTVNCVACHTDNTFKGTPTTCYACHKTDDAHKGQLGTECASCHSTTAWKPATFDHNRSVFPLTGAHVNTTCAACHNNGVFKGTPTTCFACHQGDDEHQGRFGTNCAACHSTSAWKPASFDHNLSTFPLTGAHVKVACESCHKNGVFDGTPSTCFGCHAEPQVHAGQFGTDCALCHSTSAWLPAAYNGPHTFPMNHGDATGCRDCHVGSLSQWTCYTCHDQNEIIQDHQEEGISDFANCLRCHPTGEKDEGGGGDGGDDD